MGLNISKGNMYDFVTHTWNTVKGACPHDCSYCYMKRWGNQNPLHFDEAELKTNLGSGNFIFVGSSNDLFSAEYEYNWMYMTLFHCRRYWGNKYLFQTKNPEILSLWRNDLPPDSIVCITLESNRWYHDHMGNSPSPFQRALHFKDLPFDKYITIEPIMDFGLSAFIEMIRSIDPVQVNIGADSGNNGLPEPSWDKIQQLIEALSQFTIVKEKKNLQRLKNGRR